MTGHAEDGVWVIVAAGELDIAGCDTVNEAFGHVTARCERVVVDARDLRFVDAGGVEVLLAAAAVSGVELWLRAPSEPVRLVVELTGLAGTGRGTLPAEGEVRIA